MRKPAYILTGFLGAGKTTFLNHLIESKKQTRFAIIENEFGEVGIDADLIIRAEDDIVQLNNGCLCCSLNDNLYDILSDLHFRKADFDALVIESTGIAEPEGIAEPFALHPAVKKDFELKSVICLVNVAQIQDLLTTTKEALRQIIFSNVILLHKTDLVPQTQVKEIKEMLENLNPFAIILESSRNHFPDLDFMNPNLFIGKEWTESKHSHSHHHADIVSHSFIYQPKFNSGKLYFALTQLLRLQGENIYRVKGIIHANDSKDVLLIQGVGKSLSVEPLPDFNKFNESRIIIIGKNIAREGFEKMFRSCFGD